MSGPMLIMIYGIFIANCFCFILINERLHGQNGSLLQNVLLSHPRVTEMSKLTCHVLTCDMTGTWGEIRTPKLYLSSRTTLKRIWKPYANMTN